MEYMFSEDLKAVREILGLSQTELAEKLGVQQVTISRNESERNRPSENLLESLYDFAFNNNIRGNPWKRITFSYFMGRKQRSSENSAYPKAGPIMILGRDSIPVKAMNRLFHLYRISTVLPFIISTLMRVISNAENIRSTRNGCSQLLISGELWITTNITSLFRT